MARKPNPEPGDAGANPGHEQSASPVIPPDVQDEKLNLSGEKSIYQRIRLLNEKQRKVVDLILAGVPPNQACHDAGFASLGPLATIKRKMPEIMDRAGLTEAFLVEKKLRPLLDAEEVRFFKATNSIAMIDGKPVEVDAVIETPPRPALDIRLRALDMSFKLRGAYPGPEDGQQPVRDINVNIINVGA